MNALNGALLLIACGMTALIGYQLGRQPAVGPALAHNPERLAQAPHQVSSIVDATGVSVPTQPYLRVVSASTVMDRVLLDLLERKRLIGITRFSAEHDPERHRFHGIRPISNLDDLESLISLGPDLILMNGYGDRGRIERLREAGLAVFDLGREQGFEAFLADVERVAMLLQIPGRGQRYAESLRRRLHTIIRGNRARERPSALYLTPAGDHIYGGTRGSNQHDILQHAGLRDLAAERYQGFPDYRLEALLEMSPDWVVTKHGDKALLCSRPGLRSWEPCREPQRIIELDPGLVDTGGPAMLDAAEELRRATGR